jgi:hypothetical protein
MKAAVQGKYFYRFSHSLETHLHIMPSLIDTAPSRSYRLCPPGSWDVHHHIFELDGRFPLSPTRHFTPSSATLEQLEAFQHSMGIDHVSMSHGLSFGTDLRSLQHYMKHFEGSARAYGCVDIESVTDEEIQDMQNMVCCRVCLL